MPRGEQILRQWKLLQTLQSRGAGVPLRQLADDLGVSERTIQRDFEVLQELGFPLEHEEDEFGKRFWRMPPRFVEKSPLLLSLTEALSLHLAEDLFRPLAGTHIAEGLETLLEKIRGIAPARAFDHFAELNGVIHVRRVGQTGYARHADTIRLLCDATMEQRTVEVAYRAAWSGAEYVTDFDPYGLVLFDADLFAVGRSHRADAQRTFKVNRIVAATPTNTSFERPDDFNLEAQFQSSFGIYRDESEAPVDIEVKFAGVAAALVQERDWHESQEIRWQSVESPLFEEIAEEPQALVARFRLAGVVEFKRWLKGFGHHAVVLRPDRLREEMREELLAAAKQYGED